MKHFLSAIAALAATAVAQTFTDCNPLNSTCPPDTALGVSNYSINFIDYTMSSKVWNATAGSATYGGDGANFIINTQGDAPTVKTNFHLFFGQVEVIMKAATGQGIVSSIVLQSDDLDEVDWEWIGGNNSYVQTNYFGKGNTTSYDRAVWYPVDDPQGQFHNYTTDWSREKIDWYVDGNIIRTLNYEDANGGKNFPQTPCDVRLGIWAGGEKGNNNYTIEWAGGDVDYSKAPFVMTVQSVRVSDASTGTQYMYTDHSGSMDSIKALNVTKAIPLDGSNGASASQSAAQKWKSMSKTTKIAVAASVVGALVIFAAVFTFCCLKQRRLGKHEKLLEDAKFEKNRSDVLAFRAEAGRMRTEKYAMSTVTPLPMGDAGAHYEQERMLPQRPYAQSVNSFGSQGRGYQRF